MKSVHLSCLLSIIHFSLLTHSQQTNTIRTEMEWQSTGKYKNMHNTYYLCQLSEYDPMSFYTLNITTDQPGSFGLELFIIRISPDHVATGNDSQWFFLKNVITNNPDKPLELNFSIQHDSNKTPTGFCNWVLQGPLNESFCPIHFYFFVYPCSTLNKGNWSSTTSDIPTSTVETTSQAVVSPCLCPCTCDEVSPEKMADLMEEILQDLYIHKNETTLAKRKLISASDTRWLSRGIGFTGIIVISVVFGCIFIGDVRFFIRDTKAAIGHVRGRAMSRFLRKKPDHSSTR